MHNNFEVLQSKCKKYYMKQILKTVFLVIGVLVSIFAVMIFFIDDTKVVKKEKVIKPVVKKEKPKVEVIEVVEEPDIFETEIVPKKIEDIQYNLHMYSYNLLNKKKEKIVPKPKEIKKEEKKITKPIKKEQEKKDGSFSMVLKDLDSLDSVEKMIDIYNKDKTYTVALKIAQYYYDKKNYKKALRWSKQANSIDARDEGSWLIYAKSEYALGHKKRAKAILKVYINNSHSKKAKDLLISFIKGK